MQTLPFNRKAILVVLTLLFAASVSYGAPKTVEVTGFGECSDCQKNNIQHSHAVKGLKVTIDCKNANGEVKIRASGELDKEGKFRVDFPEELVEDGKLKEECYAQLHGASQTPCPAHNGIESSKIVSLSKTIDGKHTFRPKGKLEFSPATCTSAFLWPHYKSFPKIFPKVPLFPKKPCPIKPFYKKPLLPPVPEYKKPFLPPVPEYKKPFLPPVPIYKKPVLKYKKPLLPPVPIYKKPVPEYKKPLLPPVPIYKKPFPPIFKKKPCPLPKFPPHPIFKKPYGPIYPPHD